LRGRLSFPAESRAEAKVEIVALCESTEAKTTPPESCESTLSHKGLCAEMLETCDGFVLQHTDNHTPICRLSAFGVLTGDLVTFTHRAGG
jgi:hypothetical protein